MHNQFTPRLDIPLQIPPVPIYRSELDRWYETPQVGTTKGFPVTNVHAFDSLDYRVTHTDHVTHAAFYHTLYSDQARPSQNLTAQLLSLQQHYTILDDDHLITEILEEEAPLYALLIEAVKPLRHAFGEKRIIHLRIQSSEDDIIVKVAVQWPADFGDDPERALQSFDEEWWLNNCHRSDGALVFDYEIA